MSKVIKYGVFWIPSNEIIDFINTCKKKVFNIEPNAPYLLHPVHSTLFLVNCHHENEINLINSIEYITQNNLSFSVKLSKWMIFENDVITGGNTIAVGIDFCKNLFDLQFELASKLSQFSCSKIEYLNANWTGDFEDSYVKWGFPFVGKHWLPHITVASLTNTNKEFLELIKKAELNFKETEFGNIALYKIEGDQHVSIKSFSLNQ